MVALARSCTVGDVAATPPPPPPPPVTRSTEVLAAPSVPPSMRRPRCGPLLSSWALRGCLSTEATDTPSHHMLV